VVEAAAIAHLEGLSRRPVQATTRAASMASASVVPAVQALLSTVSRSTGPTGGGSAPVGDDRGSSVVRPPPLPERQADYPIPVQVGSCNG
jgi:hypothetical protein